MEKKQNVGYEMNNQDAISEALGNTPVSILDILMETFPIDTYIDGKYDAKKNFYEDYKDTINEAYEKIKESMEERQKVYEPSIPDVEEPENPPKQPTEPGEPSPETPIEPIVPPYQPPQPIIIPAGGYDPEAIREIIAGYSYPLMAALETVGLSIDKYEKMMKSLERLMKYNQRTLKEIINPKEKNSKKKNEKNEVPMYV